VLIEEFRSLERTHELAIELAHTTIAQLRDIQKSAGNAGLNESGARMLAILANILVQAQDLEIKRHVTVAKLGGDKDGSPAPVAKP